jgi:hypothetical protein
LPGPRIDQMMNITDQHHQNDYANTIYPSGVMRTVLLLMISSEMRVAMPRIKCLLHSIFLFWRFSRGLWQNYERVTTFSKSVHFLFAFLPRRVSPQKSGAPRAQQRTSALGQRHLRSRCAKYEAQQFFVRTLHNARRATRFGPDLVQRVGQVSLPGIPTTCVDFSRPENES